MLDFIERHKIGILTTIIVHLLLVTLFLVVQFGSLKKTKKETQVEIEMAVFAELAEVISFPAGEDGSPL